MFSFFFVKVKRILCADGGEVVSSDDEASKNVKLCASEGCVHG